MPAIDLTRYIVASDGPWTDPTQDENIFGFSVADTVTPDRLLLRWAGDFVALTGPLSIRVTVQAENMTVPLALVGNLSPNAAQWQRGAPLAGVETLQRPAAASLNEAALQRFGKTAAMGLQASTIYSYTLEIGAGQAWPFSLSEHLESYRLQNARGSRFEQLGNNLGYRVVIEPAYAHAKAVPVMGGGDLPCDFAVADQPNSADFFPSACEPCTASVVGLPPGCTTPLPAPPADGGCVRTRFFDGMFITREDLETEQRYHRLKSRLHNRAAGDGVVWGLAIGKTGGRVCVMPGYGVDCCGNDLALTTVYEVDTAALLADPAVAPLLRQGGPQRVALLLEYVECPSHPRPVHGDVCAPAQARCEMSRVRESVRLRLVPPRDPKDCVESVPIAQFLAEVRELRKRYPMDAVPDVAGAARAPFQLRISTAAQSAPLLVRPATQFDNGQLAALRGKSSQITIELQPDALWTLVAGSLTASASSNGQPLDGVVDPAQQPVSLANSGGKMPAVVVTLGKGRMPDTLAYSLKGWQAQSLFAASDDLAPLGDLTLTLLFRENTLAEATLQQSPIVARALDMADAPCVGDACKPKRRKAASADDCRQPAAVRPAAAATRSASAAYASTFNRLLDRVAEDPVAALPWLHADPAQSGAAGGAGGAGDPKALLMGALGGWLAQAMVRERAGSAGEVTAPRRELAQSIYRVAWVLLFGVAKRADPVELGGTLKRLLQAWCDALLWQGPSCCGDPHGVVIGCALVDGGSLQHIDPFGGRRHVVHYPLLAHWAAQFGIAPPDITLSALFSKICCLGALPAVCVPPKEGGKAVWAQVGNAYLAVGEPREISEQAAKSLQQAQIVGRRDVGLPEMIATVVGAIGAKPDPKQSKYTALSLTDLVAEQTVLLFVPA